tara:strand:+ start:3326 stop:3463 length:138 start_codon:yes stop_codon:yes gene_type:complete
MNTGKGLIELLLRLGITPTGDRAKDIELAKAGMNKPFIKATNSKE